RRNHLPRIPAAPVQRHLQQCGRRHRRVRGGVWSGPWIPGNARNGCHRRLRHSFRHHGPPAQEPATWHDRPRPPGLRGRHRPLPFRALREDEPLPSAFALGADREKLSQRKFFFITKVLTHPSSKWCTACSTFSRQRPEVLMKAMKPAWRLGFSYRRPVLAATFESV